MTADFARERNLGIDIDTYESLMQAQKDRARSSSNFSSIIPESLSIDGSTIFLGYAEESAKSNILEIVSSSEKAVDGEINESEEGIIILDQTPFYAESGGQVGDTGQIKCHESIFEVQDTQKKGDHYLHLGFMK